MVSTAVQFEQQPKLSSKQRAFVESIHFERKSQVQAYVDAGYSVSSRQVAEACASRLARSAKVHAYLEQLRERDLSAKILDRQRKLELLSRIAEQGESVAARLKAIQILNVMQGHNVPESCEPESTLSDILNTLASSTGLPI